jgi:hypothetical protein
MKTVAREVGLCWVICLVGVFYSTLWIKTVRWGCILWNDSMLISFTVVMTIVSMNPWIMLWTSNIHNKFILKINNVKEQAKEVLLFYYMQRSHLGLPLSHWQWKAPGSAVIIENDHLRWSVSHCPDEKLQWDSKECRFPGKCRLPPTRQELKGHNYVPSNSSCLLKVL